jgi:hypothetical protein
MKKLLFSAILFLIAIFATAYQSFAAPTAKSRSYYEIRVYHFSNNQQEKTIDSFLQSQYVPVIHSAGVNNIGIFKPIANDTAADKKIYVFTPYKSVKQWESIHQETAGKFENSTVSGYENAVNNNPAYVRMETIFLKAFENMPVSAVPKLTGPKSERVYELRSYEGAGEKLYRNKVDMFNKGGEVFIFNRLGFNAVFYAEVLFGAKMPNLMYMTSFENMKSRDEHWKAFSSDPEWKALSAQPGYKNNVAHIDITYMRSTDYSDF